MRFDFSEPECSTCFHYRTSGILNTQESEPSTASGRDSAHVGSSTTSSPVHSSSPIRVGTMTPLAPPVNSEPAQSLGSTIFSDGGLAAVFDSMQAMNFSVCSGAFTTSTSSTSSPFQSSILTRFECPPAATSVSSEPAQARWANIFGSGAFAAPRPSTPSTFGSMQAPIFGSGASVTSTSSTSCPFRFESGSGPAVTSVSSPPTQALGPTVSCFGAFAASRPSIFGSMQAPVEASASSSTTSTSFSFGPVQDFGKTASASASLFGNGGGFARPDVGFLPAINSSTTTVVFGTTPVSLSTSSVCASSTTHKNPFSSLFPGFGVSNLPGSSSNLFGTTPVSGSGSVSAGVKTSSAPFFSGGSISAGVKASSSSNLFGPNPLTTTPFFSFGAAQPFGFGTATTTLFPSSSSSSSSSPAATFSSYPNIGPPLFASHEWSRCTEHGSRYPRYAPTPNTPYFLENDNMKLVSISASKSYQHKSHDELRWEDYKKGDKGGFFPAARTSPIGSRPNAVFSTSTAPPSLFGSLSIPDHPQMTTFGTTQGNMTNSAFGFVPVAGETTASSSRFGQTDAAFTSFSRIFPSSSSTSTTTFFADPTSSNVQRPHETAAVSSPASGCTACGATTSSSAPGYLNFNGVTTPPSAATSLPGLLFSTSGSSPMIFGTTPAAQASTTPAIQATTPALQVQFYPVMFGTTLVAQGTNLAVQATTPALQAYPVHGYILLPFAAMNLQ